MSRIEPEALSNPERIFLARSLHIAQRVEAWLNGAGVDYVVQVEPFGQSTIFRVTRNGAAFYVQSEDVERCREGLAALGLAAGLVDDPEAQNQEPTA